MKEPQALKWGEENNGLRCRVQPPPATEQGMPLNLVVELRCDRERLPAGVKVINEIFRDAFFELDLANPSSGKHLTVKPYDPTRGMLGSDTGRYVVPLDGPTLKPWTVMFPLVLLGDALTPGSWNAQVRFSFPQEPKRAVERRPGGVGPAGFWHGAIRSQTFRLQVLPETPRTQVFWLPRRLALEKGLRVTYRKEDAEKVTLPVRNGHIVATFIWPGAFIGAALSPGADPGTMAEGRPWTTEGRIHHRGVRDAGPDHPHVDAADEGAVEEDAHPIGDGAGDRRGR